MKISIYTILDTKTQSHLQPFFSPNAETATRAIQHCVRDSDHPFAINPEDYALFEIGTFDDSIGTITSLKTPQHILNLTQFKE